MRYRARGRPLARDGRLGDAGYGRYPARKALFDSWILNPGNAGIELLVSVRPGANLHVFGAGLLSVRP